MILRPAQPLPAVAVSDWVKCIRKYGSGSLGNSSHYAGGDQDFIESVVFTHSPASQRSTGLAFPNETLSLYESQQGVMIKV